MSRAGQAHWTSMASRKAYSTSTPQKPTHFDGHYLRNRSTLDIGVLGYIGIVWPKEHSPEVSHTPPVTPCIGEARCLKVKHTQRQHKHFHRRRLNRTGNVDVNVTLWGIGVTVVAVKKRSSITWCVCVCSLSYPACTAHAPHSHLWPAHTIFFPHHLTNGTIFEKR